VRSGSASGFQIAFLTFALLLLAVPLADVLVREAGLGAEQGALVKRAFPLALLGLVLLSLPGLRRLSLESLAVAIPRNRQREFLLVTLGMMAIPFAVVGAKVTWWWLAEGPQGVAQHVRTWPSHEAALERAFSPVGLATAFFFSAILAPIAEELAFRRFLYRAWERQWGWVVGMILSSLLFALYHMELFYALLTGMATVALYRRTRSLRSVIYAHAAYNLSIFYPLLGQWAFPLRLDAPGDLGAWPLHFACLLFVVVALPGYLFMARGRDHDLETVGVTGEPVPR
jgi:membrane protease YdiL (CAAX protease family)